MSEEWGPWIEHDGKGCPCVGMYVQVEKFSGVISEGRVASAEVITNGPRSAWVFRPFHLPLQRLSYVYRYRIRRPSALQTLIEIAANPAPLPEEVGA